MMRDWDTWICTILLILMLAAYAAQTFD